MAGDLPLQEDLVVVREERAGSRAPEPAAETAGRVIHEYGDRVRVLAPRVPDGSAPEPADQPSSRDGGPELTEIEQLGAAALELRQSAPYVGAKRSRPRQGEEWDMDGGCTAADPVRAASRDEGAVPRGAPTSAYLEGRVAVGLIMVEGPTADLQFSADERTKVVAEVQNGLSYLATADPAAGVSFVYDIRVVRLTVPPDPNAPDLEGRWRDPAMAALGYPAAWASVDRYVRDIRTRFDTRWAYCAFFTKYPVFHFAYASIGGPRLVMQYANDGWGPDNIDRVFAHETGHVFGAPDEYTASNCDCGGSWGRFGRPNVNCERCAPGGGVMCLMKGNDWSMCQVTPAHLGWMPSRMIAKHSAKVADVHSASTADGAKLVQWGYHGGMNQAFRCDPLGGGDYRLVALHSTKVLDVAGASTANGAKVIQWQWHGGANQRFRLESLGDGYVRVVAKHSGRALDVSGVSTGDGAELVQWDYHGGNNQRWLLAAANPAAHSGKVLDIAGASTGNSAQLIQWDYHGGANQAFRFERVGGGFHRIVAQHSGRVLDVQGASTANGARVIQWSWHGGDNQLFRVQPLGDGNVRITAKHSGRSLDVTAASQDNGAGVIQWDWHGGLNQRWLVPQFTVVPAGADEPQAAEEAQAADVPPTPIDEPEPARADVPAGSS
jgi:hypothetical protein